MSKKQINKSSKQIEEKKVEVKKEVEKPKVEEVKEPVKVEKKEVETVVGKKIGNSIILSVNKKELNGRTYNEVKTVDGVTFLLSDEDLKNQVK